VKQIVTSVTETATYVQGESNMKKLRMYYSGTFHDSRFADWLNDKLTEKSMSGSQLAHILGIDKRTVSAYRNCRRLPSLTLYYKIFDILS
jgi:predicted transcriptional regulator